VGADTGKMRQTPVLQGALPAYGGEGMSARRSTAGSAGSLGTLGVAAEYPIGWNQLPRRVCWHSGLVEDDS